MLHPTTTKSQRRRVFNEPSPKLVRREGRGGLNRPNNRHQAPVNFGGTLTRESFPPLGKQKLPIGRNFRVAFKSFMNLTVKVSDRQKLQFSASEAIRDACSCLLPFAPIPTYE
ncbi:unnamed protein product [Cuscuta epithymum]|uniref:Uncharacterized protein n=1 Tax=Cuscuta epithymum TaxID=186058 RepID=A0AAV0FSK4_9ASTE|nr:unnamed protein product [Cuscuta epithymum]